MPLKKVSGEDALLHLLRPIARFCVRKGIRIHAVVATLKRALVEAAQAELLASGTHESVSRVSVMTGMYRKDIQALLDSPAERAERLPFLWRLVGQWKNHPSFCSAAGKPKVLDSLGKESEFFELVESLNKEVNPYAVLFELERLGLAKNEDGKLRLVADEMIPGGDPDEGAKLVGSDLNDLLQIVEHNLTRPQETPQLHLKTTYDNIITDAVPEVTLWLLREGAEFHRRARDYLSQFDKDLNPTLHDRTGGSSVAVGTFGGVHTPNEPALQKLVANSEQLSLPQTKTKNKARHR